MAETLISPGVLARENDISFIAPAATEAGAAIIGPAVKGPVEVPTLVTSYGQYQRVFGTTFEAGSDKKEFLTSLAVKSYFNQGGDSVLVTRVVSGSFTSANNSRILMNGLETGQLEDDADALKTSTSISFVATGSQSFTGVALVSSASNGSGAEVTITVASGSTAIDTITVTSPGSGYAVGDILTIASGSINNDTQGVITLDADDITDANNPFTLETLGKGAIFNSSGSLNSDGSLISGSSDNVRWEISNINSSQGTFSLIVRRGDDNLKNKIILESFNDLSLDPNSENYIERVIGNQSISKTVDGDGNVYVNTTGEYVNRSSYIRVSGVNYKTLNYLSTDGLTINSGSDGYGYEQYLPVAQSGSFKSAAGQNFKTGDKFFGDITNTNTQGLVGANYADAISILGNTDEYIYNIISAPGLIYDFGDHKTQLDSIISTAETRGDAIAVIDLEQYGATVSNVTAAAATVNSSYTSTYWPWLQTQSATGKNEWIPASVVIPGVYAFTDGAAAPWFAPAGLTRGGISDVIQAERKLTRTQRDTLYSANVNPIATFPGSGISVFGQKTLQKKKSALDRVNVRRLLIELKKFVGDVSKTLVFEQNTLTTRNAFLSQVNPFLESVVQRQGLYAFRVVMDDTNNTADVIDRNQLVGQIFVQPAKTVEFVVLDFTIEPTGATFTA